MYNLIKNLVRENLKNLYEIDFEDSFKDVSYKELTPKETEEYLKKVISNCEKKPSDREKLSPNKPYIHGNRIPKSDTGEIDLNSFIKNITAMPKEILSINSKMAKSADDNSFSINIGIPALRGLVYDLEKQMFYIINTCPGAGACASFCYARKGSYVLFPDVFVKQTRILNLLMNYPDRFEKLLLRELESVAIKNPDKDIKMRWNDAGDFFTKKYFEIALRITKQLKSEGYNVSSYAYTKMGDVVNMQDSDFIVNLSGDINPKQQNKVKNIDSVKNQVSVPIAVFDDLLVKDKRSYALNEKGKVIFKDGENGIKELKQRIAKKYNVDLNSLLTYDEFLKAPKGEKNQYNVIVMPKGDGDIAAQRLDVKTSFLLLH